MISSIDIRNVATYTDLVHLEPVDINFIYGGNGSGKTTMSRMLSKDVEGDYDISWKDDEELKVLAFNRRFVERNFAGGINGIFTLGEDDAEALERLSQLRDESSELEDTVAKKRAQIRGFQESERSARSALEKACWSQRKAFSEFPEALKGHIASMKVFADECARRRSRLGDGAQATLEDLSARHSALYQSDVGVISPLVFNQNRMLLSEDDRALLADPVVGSGDTPIGAFIDYLQNSNWVKEGLALADKAGGRCPFCQRELPEGLSEQIAQYFDEHYELACRRIEDLNSRFNEQANAMEAELAACVAAVPEGFDDHGLAAAAATLSAALRICSGEIGTKLSDPSKKVEVDDLAPLVNAASAAVDAINADITENNRLVQNLSGERNDLNEDVWKSMLYNLKGAFGDYIKKANGAKNAIESVNSQIDECLKKKAEKEKEIDALEAKRTSIAPTVKAINDLLERFGFKGFLLAEDDRNEGMYKVVRPDGADAKATLSEGEYNFISFLYFYRLVYGSLDKQGINEPRVVVIDDPISSLDSNVMFIVTTLVKEIVKDCRDRRNGIRQVFILTHNVYFHKEVTFLGRGDWPSSRCRYWVINKMDETSSVEITGENPISTTYDLLWGEVRDVGGTPNKNLFNTMRRILEYYFKVVGGWDYERCIDSFDGADKVVCKALVSCINDGSHTVADDFVMCFSAEAMDSYRRVFEKIFDNMGHRAHYDMMMRKGATIPVQA